MLTLKSRQPVAGVKLYAGLRGVNRQCSARNGFLADGGQREFAFLRFVQTEGVVVSGSVLGLFAIGIDTVPHTGWLSEIERCSLHGGFLAERNRNPVNRTIAVGIDIQDVILHRGCHFLNTGQIEESMIRKVADCRFAGSSLIVDPELIVVGQTVGHLHFQFSGESLLAVGRCIAEHQCLGIRLFALPHSGMKAFASVQTVGSLTHRHLVFLSVQHETGAGDTVAVATDGCSQERLRTVHHAPDVFHPQHDIRPPAFAVGHHDRRYNAAIVGDTHLSSLFVRQNTQVRLLAVDDTFETFRIQP